MGIRLAQAALTARSHADIYPNGAVGADGSTSDAVLQVHLVEDRPEPEPREPWWVAWVVNSYWLAVTILTGIGIVTVGRWLIASFEG